MAMSSASQITDYLGDMYRHCFWKESADKVCEDEEDIRGKIVIVTGCNTGIGKQIALQLAKRGANVIMAIRSLEKGQAALDEIKKTLEGREVTIELMKLDLGDLQSVREFVTTFQGKYDHVDILVNNAGFMNTNSEVKKTKDGFEEHIGVNHLGPFLLTRLLLPLLAKAPGQSRIVCTSSSNLAIAPLNFMDNLMMEKGWKSGDSGKEQYNVSKLCNAICITKLANDPNLVNTEKIKVLQVCPGFVKSDVFRHETGFFKKMVSAISLGAVGLTTHQGSETVVYCAVSKSVVEKADSGKGDFYRFKKIWVKGDKILKDYLVSPGLETTEKLYKLTEELVGLEKK